MSLRGRNGRNVLWSERRVESVDPELRHRLAYNERMGIHLLSVGRVVQCSWMTEPAHFVVAVAVAAYLTFARRYLLETIDLII